MKTEKQVTLKLLRRFTSSVMRCESKENTNQVVSVSIRNIERENVLERWKFLRKLGKFCEKHGSFVKITKNREKIERFVKIMKILVKITKISTVKGKMLLRKFIVTK